MRQQISLLQNASSEWKNAGAVFGSPRVERSTIRCLIALALLFATSVSVFAQEPTATALSQMAALLSEKAARNPAQQKIDSHLVHAAAILDGRPVHPDFPTPPGELDAVRRDARNYVEVDIRADVTPALLAYIRSLGGEVVSAFAEYQSIRAQLPLLLVEQIAGRAEVREIRMADQGHGNQSAI